MDTKICALFEEESSNEMDLASEDGNVNNMFGISFQFS